MSYLSNPKVYVPKFSSSSSAGISSKCISMYQYLLLKYDYEGCFQIGGALLRRTLVYVYTGTRCHTHTA